MSVVTGFCELGLLFAWDVRLREPPGIQAVASEVCVFFFHKRNRDDFRLLHFPIYSVSATWQASGSDGS
ncbi:hypothetical protein DPMN_155360 [Dreissena polymorpha]|uniref:Uncharacterized protein n=1 Tax=Dreissena polymorpha TaxID=45954 RepID=A0A9D4FMU4_DREPO|nr:hypothetical protein DPMN_155360 [Dreissena polymorpha]